MSGQFYNQSRNPISCVSALDHAMPARHIHSQLENASRNIIERDISQSQPAINHSQGYEL